MYIHSLALCSGRINVSSNEYGAVLRVHVWKGLHSKIGYLSCMFYHTSATHSHTLPLFRDSYIRTYYCVRSVCMCNSLLFCYSALVLYSKERLLFEYIKIKFKFHCSRWSSRFGRCQLLHYKTLSHSLSLSPSLVFEVTCRAYVCSCVE